MVKKDDLKEEFSKRLLAALNDAGVGGRGQAKRIREAMNLQGISVTEPGIWKWLNAAAIPDRSNILALSRWLKVYPEWLEYGRSGESERKNKQSSIPPESEWEAVDTWDKKTPVTNDEVEVPFLKDIEFACGDGCIGDTDYNGFKLRFSKATLRRIGADTDGHSILCFPARGDSMEPNIPNGTTVAINTEDKKIVDGKIYAISEDGWKRIKLLYRTGPDTVSIRSYNSAVHPPEEKALDKITIIGRVFWWAILDC